MRSFIWATGLVGQYLRDLRSRFGIFLLVWQGAKKHWRESGSGKLLLFGKLVEHLEAKAEEIRKNRYGPDEIRIIGIDLTKRDTR